MILHVPNSLFSHCENVKNSSQLQYDGTYITLSICRTVISAGGCSTEHFRSADFTNWEEYIGITWLNNDEYTAWRTLDSTSSKADSITKVVNVKDGLHTQAQYGNVISQRASCAFMLPVATPQMQSFLAPV